MDNYSNLAPHDLPESPELPIANDCMAELMLKRRNRGVSSKSARSAR